MNDLESGISSLLKIGQGQYFVRVNHVYQMMRRNRLFLQRWFGGANIKPAINLTRVGGDNLDLKITGNLQ